MTATPDDAPPAPEPGGTPAPPGEPERRVRARPRVAGTGEAPVVRVRPVAARDATAPLGAIPPGASSHGADGAPDSASDATGPGVDDTAENSEGPLRRDEVYRHDVVSGRERPETALTRFLDRLRELLTSRSAKEEDALDARLAVPRSLDRPHVVAFASSKGGVGKTTCTVLVGSLVAEVTRRPVLAIDTNPDFGSLGRLAPDDRRSDRTMEDLLAAIEEDVTAIAGAAALSPFVSRTPSGLDLLASPRDPEVMARMTPARYGLLLDVLTRFYPVVLLDLGTGVAEALPQFALSRADQAVVVTGSSMVTNATVLDALSYVRTGDGHATVSATTVVRNMTTSRDPGDQEAIERRFRDAGADEIVSIPRDDRLATMLDSGTYALDDLPSRTRVAVKHLGLSVLDRLA